MNALVLMYVYYDLGGDIKAITPGIDSTFSNFFFATFPIKEVEDFLLGKRNPYDYVVKKIERAIGTTVKIIKKELKVNYVRTLDNYLTKIDDMKINGFDKVIIGISNNTTYQSISVQINRDFKRLLTDGTDEEQEDVENFLKQGTSWLHFTKKNNPYHLLYSLPFYPKDVFEKNKAFFKYDVDLSNSSIYTKKIVNSYGYAIRK